MRKYRNGLCAIVTTEMGKNSFGRDLFVFTNRRRNIIRFIYWDDSGFAVWTKALEKQKYQWPKSLFAGNSVAIASNLLALLLQGMNITSHKKLDYEKVF